VVRLGRRGLVVGLDPTADVGVGRFVRASRNGKSCGEICSIGVKSLQSSYHSPGWSWGVEWPCDMSNEISNRQILALARLFQEHVVYVDWPLVNPVGIEPTTY